MVDNDFAFGALLHTLRRRQRLTQQELATAIGVHRRTLVRWEQGDFLPESKALVLELAHRLKLGDWETRQLLEASLTALAPYWFVPFPRNTFFIGREEVLEALHAQLGTDQAVALTQSAALYGLGGVGKTQIALEYAYRHALEYSAVFWIGAETDEQVTASLLHIARALQLPEQEDKDQQRVIAAVQRWFSTHKHWLLIWDNVEDLDVLPRFLPASRSGAILITTRHRSLGTLAHGVELAPMEPEESILFLLCRAKLLSPETTAERLRQFATCQPAQYAVASRLITVLGGLPLALDQAGAYIEETQCTLSAYLDLFHTRRAALLQQRGQGARDHPASVSTTLTLTIVATAACHPAVQDLLRACTLLQADTIPEELFCQGGEHLGAALAAACRDPLEWDRVVGVACSYSLLSRQPEEQTLSLHRLMQAVLLDSMSQAEREQWTQRDLKALDAIFPEALSTTAYGIWKQCERLLPHALLCLQHTEPVQETLAGASLAYKVARYQCLRGQYREAEPLYRHALRIREQKLGSEHPLVAAVLDGQATLCLRQGKYAEAEPLYLRALQLQEHALGWTHPEVANTLNGLANLYSDIGRFQEVEALRLRALHIREQAFGPDHPQVSMVLHNLAVLYGGQSRYRETEMLCQRALQILDKALGPDHPQAAFSLHILGIFTQEQGRYAEAESLYRRALRIREQKLGPEHYLTAAVLTNLASLYREQSKYMEAEPLHLRALQVYEQQLGPEHPLLAEPLNGLANLYREQGRYAEAEPLYQRALSLREQHLGPSHADTAEILHNLALLRHRQEKLDEALALAERAYAIRVQTLVAAHIDTAANLRDLALFRRQQGKLDEAIILAERALSIHIHLLGDVHPKTLAIQKLSTQLREEQACEGAAEAHHGPDGMSDPAGKEPHPNSLVAPAPSHNAPSQEFLDACCELHPRACCRVSELWQAYEQWTACVQNRVPLSRRAFATQLQACGCRADRTSAARIWRGIKLRDQTP